VAAQIISSKSLLGAIFCGIMASLVTGIVENPPEANIIGATYYGFPLVWRVTMITMPSYTNILFASLAIDALFWIMVSYVVLTILMKTSKHFVKARA
jgi:hypothetical protein